MQRGSESENCSEGGVESVQECVQYEQQMIRWAHDRGKYERIEKEKTDSKNTPCSPESNGRKQGCKRHIKGTEREPKLKRRE